MKILKMITLVMVLILFNPSAKVFAQSGSQPPKERSVALGITINASLDSVWSRLSSEKGFRKFFAPACRFEPKPLGLLDIYFAPTAPAGQRGAENNRVLAIQEKSLLSFTWDAPPQWPKIREQRTVVIIRLHKVEESKTLVTLTQTGWGSGAEWDEVFSYFGKAWGGFVLPNLKYSLEVKPVDWSDFPKNAPQGLKPADTY
jgi:uncharacterized protein YndB with AHSA1/START domain